MSVTASQVSELRQKTGVGLMDCKKILVETNGDLEEAIKKLREKGLAKASKKAGRSTLEGRIFTKTADGSNKAVILELNCETDFVGGNDQFRECGNQLCDAALEQNLESADALKEGTVEGKSYADFIAEYVMKLGENISVKQLQLVNGADFVANYTHMNGKIGVLVEFNQTVEEELAKSIAMQVAASSPSCVRPEELQASELEAEREIIKKQTLAEGKPEAIVDKIVEGRIAKYYKEVCLLEQSYIKEDKKAVKEVLPSGATVTRFFRFAL